LVQTDRFRFGFLGQKPVQTSLARIFWFNSVFFGFFGFRLIKPKPNQTGWFFQNFNRFNQFFSRFGFFDYFFSGFLSLIGFLVFFAHP
jgi:hypothetical protein